MSDVARTIDCIDCGGRCHLLTVIDPDDLTPPGPGDVLSYRCEDCADRWDLVIPEEPEEDLRP